MIIPLNSARAQTNVGNNFYCLYYNDVGGHKRL